jgi:Na+-transporting methylmalonyl-CoA/oxaloacetate decarboxylase gamma subunit
MFMPLIFLTSGMGQALLNSVTNIIVVFVVLGILIGVISLFSFMPRIEASWAAKRAAKEGPVQAADSVESTVVESLQTADFADDSEDPAVIQVVIAAAIAAYEADTNAKAPANIGSDGVFVRRIKRIAH